MDNRVIKRESIKNLEKLTGIIVAKGKKYDTNEGCDKLTMEILDRYAERKYYLTLEELNKEISLQSDLANLYKLEVDKAVVRIKELENKLNIAESALNKAENKVIELSNADNCKALYNDIDSLKEDLEFYKIELGHTKKELIEEKKKKIKSIEFSMNWATAIVLIALIFSIAQYFTR